MNTQTCSPTKWFWREKKLLLIISTSQFRQLRSYMIHTTFSEVFRHTVTLFYCSHIRWKIAFQASTLSFWGQEKQFLLTQCSMNSVNPVDIFKETAYSWLLQLTARLKLMDASSTFSRSIILNHVKTKRQLSRTQIPPFAPEILISCYKIALKY